MIQILAGPVQAPESAEFAYMVYFFVIFIIAVHVVVALILSILIAFITKVITGRYRPNSVLGSRLHSRYGVLKFTLLLFGLSAINGMLLTQFAWGFFDRIRSDLIANVLFVLAAVIIPVLFSCLLFNREVKKLIINRNK